MKLCRRIKYYFQTMRKIPLEAPSGFQEIVYLAENPYTKSTLVVYKNKAKFLVREFRINKLVHEYLTDRVGATEEVDYIRLDTGGRWKVYCNGLVKP